MSVDRPDPNTARPICPVCDETPVAFPGAVCEDCLASAHGERGEATAADGFVLSFIAAFILTGSYLLGAGAYVQALTAWSGAAVLTGAFWLFIERDREPIIDRVDYREGGERR